MTLAVKGDNIWIELQVNVNVSLLDMLRKEKRKLGILTIDKQTSIFVL